MKSLAVQPNLVELVQDAIVAEIASGKLAPGARIIQEQIAKDLGVSRQPVQQALLVLRNLGVLSEAPGRGLRVAPLDLDHVRNMFDMRAVIEGLAFRKAAERNAARAARQGPALVRAGRRAVARGAVADIRAPTPSAAAELAVPDAGAWLASLEISLRRLAAAALRVLRDRSAAVARGIGRLNALHPAQAVAQRTQRLDELQARALTAVRRATVGRDEQLRRLRAELEIHSPAARITALLQRMSHAPARLSPAIRHGLAIASGRLQSAARGLQATSPLATLGRGYAIVTLAANGAVVTDAAHAPPGTEVEARLARGRLRARVTGRSN